MAPLLADSILRLRDVQRYSIPTDEHSAVAYPTALKPFPAHQAMIYAGMLSRSSLDVGQKKAIAGFIVSQYPKCVLTSEVVYLTLAASYLNPAVGDANVALSSLFERLSNTQDSEVHSLDGLALALERIGRSLEGEAKATAIAAAKERLAVAASPEVAKSFARVIAVMCPLSLLV